MQLFFDTINWRSSCGKFKLNVNFYSDIMWLAFPESFLSPMSSVSRSTFDSSVSS